VRPQIQAGRVVLQVVSHGDVQAQVANRFGDLLNRFPWPLPRLPANPEAATGLSAGKGQAGQATGLLTRTGAQGAAGSSAAVGLQTTGKAGSTAERLPTSILVRATGSPLAAGAATQGGGANGADHTSGGARLLPRLMLSRGGGIPQLLGRLDAGNVPRAPLMPHLQVSPVASSNSGVLARGGIPGQVPSFPAVSSVPGKPAAGAFAATAPSGPSRTSALLGSSRGAQNPQIGSEAQEIRGWLERLLEPADDDGPDRTDKRHALWDRLLSEKGRLLLNRWAFVPLPFRGESSGAWVQLQERAPEGNEHAEPEPAALRIWLNGDHLGAMEVLMPLQAGRTWRIRCERPESREQLEAERAHLEGLCRRAGHPVTLRVEGPDPSLGDPPESLQEAAAIERTVSSRA